MNLFSSNSPSTMSANYIKTGVRNESSMQNYRLIIGEH